MIPEDRLSTTPIPNNYRELVKSPSDYLVDWEMGGVALNDPSQGYFVTQWEGQVFDAGATRQLQIRAGTGPWQTVYTTAGNISEFSFAFDTNMNYCITFVENGIPLMRWFNNLVNQYVTFNFPDGCRSPRVCLDEKRTLLQSRADTILMYIRDDLLCFRQLRDRYTIEYYLTSGIPASAFLVDVNMNLYYRLQYMLAY